MALWASMDWLLGGYPRLQSFPCGCTVWPQPDEKMAMTFCQLHGHVARRVLNEWTVLVSRLRNGEDAYPRRFRV